MILMLIFFVMGIMVGINVAKKPHLKYPPTDEELKKQLDVAQNLNVSLKRDLNETKEKLWNLEQEIKNGKKIN